MCIYVFFCACVCARAFYLMDGVTVCVALLVDLFLLYNYYKVHLPKHLSSYECKHVYLDVIHIRGIDGRHHNYQGPGYSRMVVYCCTT